MSEDIILQLTLSEALSLAAKEPPPGAKASRREEKEIWAGGSWEQALDRARNGSATDALQLRKKPGIVAAIRQAKRATTRYAVSGSQVDVGRYLSGEPECMVETVRARRSSPVIRLAIERAVAHSVSDADIRATGTSVLAVVEALRTAGVPSEVWVTSTISEKPYEGRKLSMQVLVQEAGRPINIDRLAWWVISPSVLRRIGFAIYEQQTADVRAAFNIGGGYGYAAKTPDRPKFDEIVPAYERQASEWIADVLTRRAGVTITA